MKKFLAVLMSIVLVMSLGVSAFAAVSGDNDVLKFDENGEFKIFNICDIQDMYPLHKTTKAFITDMLKIHKPDIVVLGGDNTVADNAIPDVKMDDANAEAIYSFYRAGILTGSDAAGTFNESSSIKRSEVAAILSRMYNENVRQAITLN